MRNIEDAIGKYDRAKEQEEKKEARKRKAAENAIKLTSTPRRKDTAFQPNQSKNQISTGSLDVQEKLPKNSKVIDKEKVQKEENYKANQAAPLHTDPRQALLQSIAKRRSDTSLNTKPEQDQVQNDDDVQAKQTAPLHTDPRQALLQSIVQRRSETSPQINNVSSTEPKLINEQNGDDISIESSSVRSSRSLLSGIMPDCEMAITKIDP